MARPAAHDDGQRTSTTRRLTLAGLFAALAVLLSLFAVPVGGARVLPFQHAINAVAGVMLGPWWAAGSALVAAGLRISFGLGTPFALVGSPFGAIAVGLVYRFWRRDEAALFEPVGTVLVGAPLGAIMISPLLDLGAAGGTLALMISFALSSIPGAILGYVLLKALRKAGAIR
ncbi:MAG TPA: energy coupling factor transporter S component ThiW [Rubrobacteraceae bacterium]|nr:energy coupling factor transporter S component ThiW [Rubrobacteraceae bacterium]